MKIVKQILDQIGNYKATQVEQGLLINDVELSVIEAAQTGPLDVTIEHAERLVATFKLRQLKRKVGAFVRLNHGGPGIGQILDLRISDDKNFLVGDLLVSNPDAFEMVKRGELTERSITFDKNRLFDISLLSGSEGQDSEEFDDLTVDIEKEFGKIEGELLVKKSNINSTSIHKEPDMALSKEDILALAEALKPTITAAVQAEIEKSAPVSDEAAVEAQAAKLIEGDRAQLAELKRKQTVKGYVDSLVRGGNHLNSFSLSKIFEALGDNYKAMEIEYKRLSEKKYEDIKLEVEKEWETPTFEQELAVEYKNYKAHSPNSTVSEEDYVKLAKGGFKADLSNKKITKVS